MIHACSLKGAKMAYDTMIRLSSGNGESICKTFIQQSVPAGHKKKHGFGNKQNEYALLLKLFNFEVRQVIGNRGAHRLRR